MKTDPKKDAPSHTGSNLRRSGRDALYALRAKLRAKQTQLYRRKAREFQSQLKKIFSKADLRTAAGIIEGMKKELELTSFKAGADARKRDAVKIAAQKKLHRLLAKALPAYSKFADLKTAHLLELAELTEAVLYDPPPEGLAVQYGGLLDGPGEGSQDFVAPFPIFDTHADDSDSLIDEDHSFANTTFSQTVNNLVVHDDVSSPFSPWGFNFSRVKLVSSFASCGINYTMPRTGRLQLSALLTNTANRASLSLSDNLGLSYGNLTVRLLLFISVVRGGQTSHLTRTLLAKGLSSDGSDLSYTMPVLMNAAPYLVNGFTNETFSAGESVQILVGSEVQVDSELNDMESRVNALMVWRLNRISVAVFGGS